MKETKSKNAKIIYMANNKKVAALVDLSSERTITELYRKTKFIKHKILNLDGKEVLSFEDSIWASTSVSDKVLSSIVCYDNFFVREQSLTRTEPKAQQNAYAYQVYDYNGKALFCSSDMWTGDEEIISHINQRASELNDDKVAGE